MVCQHKCQMWLEFEKSFFQRKNQKIISNRFAILIFLIDLVFRQYCLLCWSGAPDRTSWPKPWWWMRIPRTLEGRDVRRRLQWIGWQHRHRDGWWTGRCSLRQTSSEQKQWPEVKRLKVAKDSSYCSRLSRLCCRTANWRNIEKITMKIISANLFEHARVL